MKKKVQRPKEDKKKYNKFKVKKTKAKAKLVESAFGNLDTKIERLTDKVSAFEKRFADSRVAEHMWYLESILKYCAENKKFLYDADARGKTFLQEIEGEMKSRGVGIDPNIHKQVLDEMADDIKDERDEQDKKRDQV